MERISSLGIITSSNKKSCLITRQKNTTYRQRYNKISALEVHTIGKIQHLWTLCALQLQLQVAEQLFALSIMLEFDDDKEFMLLMMMHMHHCMHIIEFFSALDNILIEITSDQVIPHLVLVNMNCTFDLLHPEWCYEKTQFHVAQLQELYLYHLLEFSVMFVLSERRHCASLEEAFSIMLMKLATGDSNVVLAHCFCFSRDGMVSLIYRYTTGVINNKARGLFHDGAGCLGRWAHLFPELSEIITRKLNMPQYGGLAFQSCHLIGFLDCKFDETCAPGLGPMMDEELADCWSYSRGSVLWILKGS
jgi:hypothetical protein